ncbi:hypothetical protein IQ243_24685 [Nostocales cyanobacterium LEGE 11386]|nr:hypothetical protein [Nostocales cyanobacterium LEGE 11386]
MSITEENLKDKEKIFIPFDVEDAGLSICAFRIYGHLSNPTAEYPKTSKMISQHIRANHLIVKKAIHELIEKALIEEFTFSEEEALQLIRKKVPQSFSNSRLKCSWCNGTTVAIQKHHYPVKRSEDGKEVVNICPSCHCEFHFLTDRLIQHRDNKL